MLVVVVALLAAPPVLTGIDTLPSPAAVAQTPPSALLAALHDESAIVRARALRSLAARADVDAAVFAAACAVGRRDPVAEVRTQAALAEGDREKRRAGGAVVAFAATLLRERDAALRTAGVVLLVRERTPAARAVLAGHVDPDPLLARQVAARLRRWR